MNENSWSKEWSLDGLKSMKINQYPFYMKINQFPLKEKNYFVGKSFNLCSEEQDEIISC